MSALTFDDVHKQFDQVPAVAGVSLTLEPGELFCVIGPSGCGKTTLLRIAAGLEVPDRGRVLSEGKEITRFAPEKRGMAMVFQSYALFAHLSVLDNVAFGLRYAGVPRGDRAEVARRHLDKVGLAGLERRMPAELSGGQQQRVALARALAVSPRILLLDEPLSNLDARLRESTRLEIKALLAEQKVTALYVTHDQEEAMALADRLAVMQGGRLEQVGAPEEVYRRPASAFVARFASRANLLDGVVVAGAEASGEPRWQVTCGAMSLCAAAAGGLEPRAGDAVRVALRPESLRLGFGDMRGRLDQRAFLGATTAYVLRVDERTLLHGLAAEGAAVPAAGEPISFHVADGEAVIVRP